MYLGTSGDGILRSVDAGLTWSASHAGFAYPHLDITCLAVDPLTPSTVYAGTSGDGFSADCGGILRSTDAGVTWTPVNNGMTKSLGYYSAIRQIAIDPITPSTVYAMTTTGILRSSDRGATWEATNSSSTAFLPCAFAVNPITPSTLYATTNDGVYRSTDRGTAWTRIGSPYPGYGLITIAVDPTAPTTLYSGGDRGVSRSMDGGATWTTLPLLSAYGQSLFVNCLAIDPTSSSTLYAGTDDGVMRSGDSGGHWTAINSGLADRDVHSIVIDPAKPSVLYALTFGGVSRYEGASSCRLLVAAFPSEGGSVSQSPSGSSFAPGTVVTLTATPWPGYVFNAWSGVPTGVDKKSLTINVAVDADLFVVAAFTPHPTVVLTPSAGVGGTITPNTPQIVSRGGSFTFTIIPDAGYHASSVVVNGTSVGNMTSYTFTDLTADHTIVVSFAPGPKRVITLKIGDGTMHVDGTPVSLQAPPVVLNSRTFLPIRAIGEAIGAFVSWDAPTRTVEVTRGGSVLQFMIDWNTAKVNGSSVRIDPQDMDVVPVIMNGRTLLPLRFVAETLGLDVQWNAVTKTITITDAA
jgi:photosystem II stability/assembly factor-like uncharacterized protein